MSKVYCYEVRVSFQSPDDKLERSQMTFLVEDFSDVEDIEKYAKKSISKILMEGYTLRRVRSADAVIAYFGELSSV